LAISGLTPSVVINAVLVSSPSSICTHFLFLLRYLLF
jgi:hypothetical protein